MSLRKKTWLISKAQIGAGDIDSAIFPVDPEQVPDQEIYGLHGVVRLRVEGVKGPIDIFGHPVARKYFQALHQRWPYAGFFLRICPITFESPQPQIIRIIGIVAWYWRVVSLSDDKLTTDPL